MEFWWYKAIIYARPLNYFKIHTKTFHKSHTWTITISAIMSFNCSHSQATDKLPKHSHQSKHKHPNERHINVNQRSLKIILIFGCVYGGVGEKMSRLTIHQYTFYRQCFHHLDLYTPSKTDDDFFLAFFLAFHPNINRKSLNTKSSRADNCHILSFSRCWRYFDPQYYFSACILTV